MKILVTGFEPFGGETLNPSYEAVKLLPDEIKGAKIIKREMPTVFNEAIDVLKKEIEAARPDAVVCCGQAGEAYTIRLEKVAINLNDARIEDNKGNQPTDETIVENAPAAYFATLPVKKIVGNLKNAEIPAAVSYSAGTFVCNNILYGLLHFIATTPQYRNVLGGFIHVPYCNAQVIDKRGMPFMTVEMIKRAFEICIETLID